MKKTKIVCTIGPASESKEIFRELIKSGLNVARLNFSHGSHEEHLVRINMIKEVREEMNEPIAILLDTKGPEIRTGKFFVPVVELIEGQEFTLTTEDYLGDQNKCSISYTGLVKDVVPGNKILIDDGLIELEVIDTDGIEIKTKVLNAGPIKNHKGVNVPEVNINLPAVTEKDIADIKFGIENGIDFVAASFIRKAQDVLEIRKILEDNGAHDVHIISKIENQQGVDNIEEILRISDALMIARGDLGVEIPTEDLPVVQKRIIQMCNKHGKPVITATQMLDSMMRNPRPTRAEITDVANAIYDGTDAIMLSGETAAGKYPLESLQMMAKIAMNTEKSLDYRSILKEKSNIIQEAQVSFAVSHATCTTAQDLEASAIITATTSGFTTRKVSQFRPECQIIAVTNFEKVRRNLALSWGVTSLFMPSQETTDLIFDNAIKLCKENGFINNGQVAIITAGVPIGITGVTNIMKVHLVGEILIKGLGIGKGVVAGKVCVIDLVEDAQNNFKDGDIIVASNTDIDLMPYINRCSGMIIEESGYTSHSAIVALNLNIPSVVGARDAKKILFDGDTVTIDSSRGIIYAGRTRVL